MRVFVIQTCVDPFYQDECPILVSNTRPTRKQVWDLIKHEQVFQVNEVEDEELGVDGYWGYECREATVVDFKG